MSAIHDTRTRIRKADAAELDRLQRLYAGDKAVQKLLEKENQRRTLQPLSK